jgi:hypothetical protein
VIGKKTNKKKVRNNEMSKLAFFLIIFMAPHAFANPITLDNKEQVSIATKLHEAMGELSGRVTDCVEIDKKSIEECACRNYESCQFKAEYKQVVDLYCGIKKDFPEWNQKTVNYTEENSGRTVALGMVGLDKIFGEQFK